MMRLIQVRAAGALSLLAAALLCGEAVARAEGEVASRCLNPDCPAKLKETVRFFASRGVMDIDGMGDSLVEQLVGKGMVRSVADIYDLSVEALAGLDRMGQKSAERILRGIEASRTKPLPRVLNGLGIPFVGERTAQLLADEFGSLDAIAGAGEEALQSAREVGPKVAASIASFFAAPRNRELVERLRQAQGLLPEQVRRRRLRLPKSAPASLRQPCRRP